MKHLSEDKEPAKEGEEMIFGVGELKSLGHTKRKILEDQKYSLAS